MKKRFVGFLIAIAMVIVGLALTVPVSKVSASDECPDTVIWILDTEWYANPQPGVEYHNLWGDDWGYYCPDGESTPIASTTMTASPTMPVSATPSSTAVSTVVKTEEPTMAPTEVTSTNVVPTGQPTDVLTTSVPTEDVTATEVTPTEVTATGEPTNEVTPTEVLPTAVPTEEVTATEPPRCDGDCPTATVSPTLVPTVVVSQTPPPTGGGACATSNFEFSVGESLVAFWTDSSAQLKGWIIVTEKGELVIQFANGERNSGELKVQNLDGSKSQFVEVGATGCNPPEATATITPPKSVSTPVPFNEDRANIKLKVDCTGYTTLTFDGAKFVYSRAEYVDSSGNHGLIFSPATGGWSARIPFRDDVVSVTAWLVDAKNQVITVRTTVDFTNCARPVTEIKVVVATTPVPTPEVFSQERSKITLNVGAALSKDPGITLFPNGQKFESMWLVTSTYRVQLDTWTNNLSVCQNLILANFEYLPLAGETAEIAEIVAIMGGHYTVRTVVQTTGSGSDVNCSNLRQNGDAWTAHWYGGNTYQSWKSFLGYTGTLEKFIDLMEMARGENHSELFELPETVIEDSSIFSNN